VFVPDVVFMKYIRTSMKEAVDLFQNVVYVAMCGMQMYPNNN